MAVQRQLVALSMAVALLLLGCLESPTPVPVLTNLPVRAQLSLPVSTPRTLVALTYDDGLYTQRKHAITQLDSFGFSGTFFLNTVEGREAILDWHNAASKGHELANHSLFHPCPQRYGWPAQLSTEAYDEQRFLDELATQHQLLDNIEDASAGPRSYAHPCNYHFIDSPAVSTLPVLDASPLVRHGRTGGDRNATILPGIRYERLAVPSWTVDEGASAAELISFVELAAEREGAAVFTFHGIGADWIVVSREAHEGLLSHLRAHADRFEVVTFAELSRQMLPREEAEVPTYRYPKLRGG